MSGTDVTFSFGENWLDYLETLDAARVREATADIEAFLGSDAIPGLRVLDVGSGSGLHSLAFQTLGAAEVHAMDVDPRSVTATRRLCDAMGDSGLWTVHHASILDADWLQAFRDRFDLVYAWGSLHHTGELWRAVENSIGLVNDGGRLWLAIYVRSPAYSDELALKQRYNRASPLRKRLMVADQICRLMLSRLRRRKNPLRWNERRGRGMNAYHDIIDWLGGLPYEVASREEVVRFCEQRGMRLDRCEEAEPGGCSEYLFRRVEAPGDPIA